MDEDQSRKMLKERYIDFGPTQVNGSVKSTLVNALPGWAKLSSDSEAHRSIGLNAVRDKQSALC